MSRSTVGMRLVGVAWDDGDHDEPHRADASAGTDRHCRRTAIGGGRDGAGRGWAKTDLSSAGCISNSRCGRLDFAEAWPTQQPSDPPTDPRELIRHYTLSAGDLAIVHRCRGEHNRLGRALMLCYLHYPGRPLRAGERPTLAAPQIIEHDDEELKSGES